MRRVRVVLAATALALLAGVGPAAGAPRPATTSQAPAHPRLSQADNACEEGVPRYIPDRSPSLARLAPGLAWTLSTGQGVVVAVVDSGVSTRNVHFPVGSVLPGRSFVDGGSTEDDVWHGTAVAGLIAARPIGSTSGVVGLAKDAVILPVKVTGRSDQGEQRAARVADGIRWAADNGARVINVSLSTATDDPALREAVAYAVARDSVVVASAGNRSTAAVTTDGLRYPAAYPGVIGVAAADEHDVLTNDSIHGPQVALAAPGYAALTAFRDWGDCVFAPEGQASSFATAYVSAAAALLRARFPEEAAPLIAHRLQVTAARANRGARDDVAGWGIIAPYEALSYTLDASLAGPLPPGATRAPSPSVAPQALDLRPIPDPTAAARAVTLAVLLACGSAVVGLAMWRLVRSARSGG